MSTRCSPSTRQRELASLDPAAGTRIHRRAAGWLRSQGLPIEATEHAAAAGDHELVAELLVEYHLPLIRSGATRTLLRRVRALPEERLVEHPELAAAAATAALMAGQSTMELRRFLSLVDRARAGRPEGIEPVRRAAARHGARAHDRRRACGRRCSTADVPSSWRRQARTRSSPPLSPATRARSTSPASSTRRGGPRCGCSSIPTPSAECRAGARPLDARPRRGRARAALLRPPPRREGEGDRRRDRDQPELARRERLGRPRRRAGGGGQARRCGARARRRRSTSSRDEVATVHHAWLLVLLAGVRVRRGRLDEAEATLRAAREELGELTDSGRDSGARRRGRARARGRQVPRRPAGSCSSRRPRPSSRCSGCWPPTSRLGRSASSSSSRPTRSASHKRALYRKLGVNARADAVARATALGLAGASGIIRVIRSLRP